MWILVSAIVTSSLLGSMHCVGMCGPLAIWASGAGDRISTNQMTVATTLYHLGRLLTYALVGVLAGAAGQLLDMGGQTLGMQLFAARIVGGLMIVFGLLQLLKLASQNRPAPANFAGSAPQPSLVTRWLLKLRPWVFRLPVPARGLTTGLLTALLPCGWLYLFALVAAGTGSMLMGSVVMIAFWIGTVPALVGLVTGTQALAFRFRRVIPIGAAGLLIVGGGYTASGRGFASLNSLSDIRLSGSVDFVKPQLDAPQASADALEASLTQLLDTPLPCCTEHPSLSDESNVARRSASEEFNVARRSASEESNSAQRSASEVPPACPLCNAANSTQESSAP
ncbi:MAG: sulfite exporter TauE/SafE family protein [Planctomycetales bacterium]|nr:sulfite exporter TauE/SafE family protein [Planctomycetales bacterium]